MTDTIKIPEEIHNEVLAFRTRNNDLVEKAASMMEKMGTMKLELQQVESERLLSLQKLIILIRNKTKVGIKDLHIDFDKMELTPKGSPPIITDNQF